MFKLAKNKKRRNVIAERIEALDNKLWLIQMTDKKYGIDTKVRFTKSEGVGISESYKVFTLNTAYGERKIAINSYSLYYGSNDLIRYNSKDEEHLWSFDFNFIFYIGVKNNRVIVEFPLDLELSKEEVDLAILEFEEAIESTYKFIINKSARHNELIRYLMEGH